MPAAARPRRTSTRPLKTMMSDLASSRLPHSSQRGQGPTRVHLNLALPVLCRIKAGERLNRGKVQVGNALLLTQC
jgi:hypothetical protein